MAKNPKLRTYQRTAIESARRALTKSGSCILQMPTGAGKTRSATEIVAHSRGVIWFVCHRQEIERQVAKAFTAAGIDFGVVSPRGELEPKKRVQIVSVHTLRERLKKLPLPKLVIWDECHHVAAKSWASIRAKLKDARHLGLTATPERLDGKGLGEWFKELVTGPGIAELIKKGFLSEFRYFAPSDPDLTSAKLQAGDYKKSDLGKIMNTPVLIGDAVREYKKNAKGKRALAFCASVEASQALAVHFNKEGIAAAHVDGTTPTAERDLAVQDLAAGKIKVLCNVEVFTEGFDLPAIDAVILMRPTKSPTLLLQMIGRGLRKAPGKDTAIIMDHAGLHRDHAWFADDWHWSLDGGAAKAKRAAVTRGPRRCPECREVRAERVEVCSCGYEFPSGREIGEFDGVLTEVKSRRRYRRGPPMNVADPAEYCSPPNLARKLGVSQEQIYWAVKNGMPCADNGWPHEKSATEWAKNRGLIGAPRGVKLTSVKACAVAFGISDFSAKKAIQQAGLKKYRGRFFEIKPAHKAIRAYMESSMYFDPGLAGCERKAHFARRVSTDPKTLDGWIRRGLPVTKNGWVIVDRAMAWLKARRTHTTAYPPRDVSDPRSYISRVKFGALIGYRPSYAHELVSKWVDSGLPCASNGWVHIQRGLEWVRDNTNIKIPASAWPKKATKVKSKQREPDERRLAA